jgi:hypothetical protein
MKSIAVLQIVLICILGWFVLDARYKTISIPNKIDMLIAATDEPPTISCPECPRCPDCPDNSKEIKDVKKLIKKALNKLNNSGCGGYYYYVR